MRMLSSGGKVQGHERLHDRLVDSAPSLAETLGNDRDDPRYRLREATQPTRHDNNEWRVHTTFFITEHDPATGETRRTNYP